MADEAQVETPAETDTQAELAEATETINQEQENIGDHIPKTSDAPDEEPTEPTPAPIGDRPEWLDDAYWDADKQEVNVEGLQKSLKDTQTALRNKQNTPEVTDENPFGYDKEFLLGKGAEGDDDYVQGLGFSDEELQSEDFLSYAQEAIKNGVPQDIFEYNMRTFTTWKADYDKAMGYDIDAQAEANNFVGYLEDKFGNKANDHRELAINYLNSDNLHPDVAWALSLTDAGLRFAHAQATSGLNPTPVKGTGLGGRTLEDVNTEITKLQTDPRRQLGHGDPQRVEIEKQIDQLFKDQVDLGGGVGAKPGRYDRDFATPNQTAEGQWAEQAQQSERFKKIKLTKSK